jgi:hypothetical protein
MTSEGILQERRLQPLQSSHRAMREAGGLWAALGRPDPAAIVAEVRRRGIRALEVQHADIGFLAELPELEFLYVASDPPDATPVMRLPNLRFLSFTGTWGGRLDFGALPRLEWFSAVECPRGGGGLDSLFAGHDQVLDLGIGRYPWADLTAPGALRLRRLAIWDSRAITGLDGLAALAPTLRGLDLDGLPNLPSLAGLEVLADLEVLRLGRLRHVTELSVVRELPSLRALHVFELKDVASLAPLAGHPALECLTFGRIRDLDLAPLESLSRLRLVHTGRYRWNRDLDVFPNRLGMETDDPAVAACDALHLG